MDERSNGGKNELIKMEETSNGEKKESIKKERP